MICSRNLVEPLWAPDFNNSLLVFNLGDSAVLARMYPVGISFLSISVGKYDERKGIYVTIQAFSTSFYFSQIVDFRKTIDKL